MKMGKREREMDGMGRIGGEAKSAAEFSIPEGVELEGESGSAMVDWELTPEGTIRIVAFDGVSLAETSSPMGEEEEEAEIEIGGEDDDEIPT